VIHIGACLSAAREARGLTLADAEQLTCIRAKQLAALEREAYDELPARAYARAFLRTYAAALGLDADRLVVEFEEQVPEPEDETPAPPGSHRQPPIKVWATAAAAVGMVAIAGWGIASGGSGASVPARARASAPPAPPAPPASGTLGARHVAVVKTRPSLLRIRASRGDCWLMARRGGPSGAVLYEGMLREGRALRFAATHVWLRLGAPGAVDVTRGSRPVHGLAGTVPLNVTA
jgi:transcriptional regulator with XRE-family HTH domain